MKSPAAVAKIATNGRDLFTFLWRPVPEAAAS